MTKNTFFTGRATVTPYILTCGKMRRGAILEPVLTSKDGLVDNVKPKGSLGCSDHEMVELLRAVRRAHSKLTTLDFRRADFDLFRGLLSRVLWDKALEGKGPKKAG
ncbi:pecanex-like protein hypothetical protein [Limosa lapponica baueri]|uniref:Glycerol kinase n=1 Tax=Limosa lapponica baueri TaxID=1758121 RepID=A0A2I0U5J8_LIMLA|nr:pecanex-like protein hypothetical protein [Limosa lapponica baueri]